MAGDELSSFLDSAGEVDRQEEEDRVRVNEMRRNLTPDQAAARQRAATELGVTPEAVDELAIQQVRTQQELDRLNATPRLRAWLADPYNYDVGADDTRSLSLWERLGRLPGDIWNLPSTVSRSFRQGQRNVEQAQLANRLNPRRARAYDDAGRLTGAETLRWQELARARRVEAGNIFETVAEQLPQIGASFQSAGRRAVRDARHTHRQIYGNAGLEALGTVEGLALLPVTGLASSVSGVGGLIRGFVGSAYEQEAGHAFIEYSRLVDADGRRVSEELAGEYAHRVGLINAGIEFAGLATAAKISGVGEILQQVVRPGVRESLRRVGYGHMARRFATGTLGAAGAEGLTELTQESVNIAMADALKKAQGGDWDSMSPSEIAERLWESFSVGAQVGGVFGSVGAGARAIRVDLPAVRRAEIAVEIMEAATEAAQSSTLRTRSPSRYAEAVNALTRDGPLQTFRIDARRFEQYWQEQGYDPAAVAAELEGVGAQRLIDALDAGGELEIPAGTYAARIAGTQHKELGRHVRFGPDQLTPAEIEARVLIGADLEKAEAEGVRLYTEHVKQEDARKAVYDHYKGVLGEASAHDPRADDFYARMWTEAVMAQAAREGIEPMALVQQFDLKVRGPFDAQVTPETFTQARSEGYRGRHGGEAMEWLSAASKGLDMSPAGRRGRAAELGWRTDLTLYVGGRRHLEIVSARQPLFLAANPKIAGLYAKASPFDSGAAEGGNITPVWVRGHVYDAGFLRDAGALNVAIREARKVGAAVVRAVVDDRGGRQEQYVVIDPRAVRSVHAAFDPDLVNSQNIYAQSAAPAAAPAPVISDASLEFGTADEIRQLAAMIDDGASAGEIFAHPVMQRLDAHAATAKPTMTQAQSEDPAWLAERQYTAGGLGEAIEALTAHFTRFGKSFERRAVIVTGHPGAGKTRFVEAIALDMRAAVPEGDAALGQIPEYEGGKNTPSARPEARFLVGATMAPLIERGVNIVQERVGEDAAGLAQAIAQFKADGYQVSIVHVHVEADEAVRRMTRRFIETGRYVAPSDYAARMGRPQGAFTAVVASDQVRAYVEIDGNGTPNQAHITQAGGDAQGLTAALGGVVRRKRAGVGDDLPAADAAVRGDRGNAASSESAAQEGREQLDENAAAGRVLRGEPPGDGSQGGSYFQTAEDDPPAGSNPIFYSSLERAVAESKTARASPEQWQATLARAPGVKREEIEWVGLNEWLDSRKAPAGANSPAAVTRDEILEFLRDHSIVLLDAIRGGPRQTRTERVLVRGGAAIADRDIDITDFGYELEDWDVARENYIDEISETESRLIYDNFDYEEPDWTVTQGEPGTARKQAIDVASTMIRRWDQNAGLMDGLRSQLKQWLDQMIDDGDVIAVDQPIIPSLEPHSELEAITLLRDRLLEGQGWWIENDGDKPEALSRRYGNYNIGDADFGPFASQEEAEGALSELTERHRDFKLEEHEEVSRDNHDYWDEAESEVEERWRADQEEWINEIRQDIRDSEVERLEDELAVAEEELSEARANLAAEANGDGDPALLDRLQADVESRQESVDEAQEALNEWTGGGDDRWVEREIVTGMRTEFGDWTLAGGAEYTELVLRLDMAPPGLRTHFHDPSERGGIIHARFNTRSVVDGDRQVKVLFIEEFQSDPHQDANAKIPGTEIKRGYEGDTESGKLRVDARDRVDLARATLREVDVRGQAFVESLGREAISSLIRSGGENVRLNYGDVPPATLPARHELFALARDGVAAATGADGISRDDLRTAFSLADEYDAAAVELDSASAVAARLARHQPVPNIPFKQSWPAVAFKRMIRWAADNGHEKIAWTTGEQQSSRYNRTLTAVEVYAAPRGSRHFVSAPSIDAATIAGRIRGAELSTAGSRSGVLLTEDQVLELFGAEIGARVLQFSRTIQDGGQPSNVPQASLTLNSRGMTQFYDKVMVNVANDILKKMKSGRVTRVDMSTRGILIAREERAMEAARARLEAALETTGGRLIGPESINADIEYRLAQRHLEAARAVAIQKDNRQIGEQWSFDVTPEMKAEALKGFPYMQAPERGRNRGGFDPETFTINLFEARNASTFLHESGHAFLELLFALSGREGASAGIVQDRQTVLDWFGLTLEQWDSMDVDARRVHHEKFARGFEAYLREGRAPSSALADVFRAFRLWLTNIYKSITELRVDLTPEIRGVMDRLLATQEAIDEAASASGADAPMSRAQFGGVGKAADRAYERYAKSYSRAKEDALAEVTQRAMDAFVADRQRWFRAEERRIKPAVEIDIDSQPARRALDWLTTGTWRHGDKPAGLEEMRLSASAVGEDYGDLRAALPERLLAADPEALVAQAREVKRTLKRGLPVSLSTWVQQRGGVIDAGGEIIQALGRHTVRPGLINNTRGRSADDVALAAQEAGFFGVVQPQTDLFGYEQFGGERADYAPFQTLQLAKDMEAAGVAPDRIWREAGWFRGLDTRWRFEIDDVDLRLRVDLNPREMRIRPHMRLSEIIDWPSLFAAYPELSNVTVRTDLKASGGFAAPTLGVIAIGRLNTRASALSVLRHEIQHMIQFMEGDWAEGFSSDLVEESHPRYAAAYSWAVEDRKQWAELMEREVDISDPDVVSELHEEARYNVYYAEMGEIEAREVERRARSRDQVGLDDEAIIERAVLTGAASYRVENLGADVVASRRDILPMSEISERDRALMWNSHKVGLGGSVSQSAVHHGSARPLNYDAGALFATDSEWAAEAYASRDASSGLRRVTMFNFDFTRPLVVDGSAETIGRRIPDMRAFLEAARADGHDGVIINGVIDYRGNVSNWDRGPINVYVALDPAAVTQLSARYLDGGALANGVARIMGSRQYFQGDERVTLNEFLDALIGDIRGSSPVYRRQDADQVESYRQAQQMRDWFAARGVNIDARTPELRSQIERISGDQGEGLHPDVIASVLNGALGYQAFDSGRDLLEQIAALTPRSEAIAAEIRWRIQSEVGDPMADASLMEDARRAAHNSARAQTLEIELEALARATGHAVRPMQRAMQSIAQERVRAMSIREVRNYDWFLGAERREAKLAMEAIGNDDLIAAEKHKRAQMLNFYLYRVAREAADVADKAQRYFRQFDRPGVRENIAADYVDQIDGLLEQYELRNISGAEQRRRASLAQWAQSMKDAGNEQAVAIDPRILADARRRPFTSLSFDEMLALRDTVLNIEHLGRLKERLLDAKDARSFSETVGAIVDRLRETGPLSRGVRENHSPNAAQRVMDGMREAHAEMTRMEFLFRHLDGGEANGPIQRALWLPFADAADVEAAAMARAARRISAIWKGYNRDARARLFRSRIRVPALRKRDGSFSYTKAEIMGMALNWGNEGNRESLLAGHGWSAVDVEAAFDAHLSRRDWVVVQSMWDLIGEFRDDAFRLQEDITGVRPEAVEAMPVMTRHGVFPGGYYPLKFDAARDMRVMRVEEKQQVQDLMGSNWSRPMTKQGHLQERSGSGGRPVRLDFSVFTEHLQNVIHDIAYRRAVIDADRVIQSKAFTEAFTSVAGVPLYKQLRPWLQAIAADRVDPSSWMWRAMQHFRGNTAIYAMGYRASTSMQQITGLLQAVPELGSVEMAGALVKLLHNPTNIHLKAQVILGKSQFMRNRMTTFDRDVRETIERIEKTDLLYTIRRNAFALVGMFDWAVSSTVWTAAYDKAMSGRVNGVMAGDESASVAYSDSVVRRTQSAGLPQDLPAIMRGSQVNKLLTMFFSYFSVLYNWAAYEQFSGVRRGRIPLHIFIGNMALIFLVAPLLAEGLAGRWGLREDEDEDDRNARLAMAVGKMPFMTVPGVRDVAGAFGTDFDYQISPVGGAFNTMIDAAERAARGETFSSEYGAKQAAQALGYAFGLPTGQAWVTIDYVIDQANGEEDGFDFFEAVVADTR